MGAAAAWLSQGAWSQLVFHAVWLDVWGPDTPQRGQQKAVVCFPKQGLVLSGELFLKSLSFWSFTNIYFVIIHVYRF